MSTIITYIFILMILTLLIGFFLGWIFRRSTYRDRYERDIDELALRNENMSANKSIENTKLETNIFHLEKTKENIKAENEKQNNYLKQNNELNKQIQKLKNEEIQAQSDIQNIDKQINMASDELGILTSSSDYILEYKSKIKEIKTDIITQDDNTENQKIKILNMDLETKDLNTQVYNLEKNISNIENQVNDIEKNSETIQNQFTDKMAGIQSDLQKSNHKMLNYKYAVNYTDERIEANENIEFNTIDKIISKNEQKSPFENIIQKLFSKSAKYIKGGK